MWAIKWLALGIWLEIPAPFLAKFIEGGIPVNGGGVGELPFKIGQRAGCGYDERDDGFYFLQGYMGIIDDGGKAVKGNTHEDDFLIDANGAGSIVKGVNLIWLDALAVVAVGNGVLIALGRAG